MTNREKIVSQAIAILKDIPQGIRYSDFVRQVHGALPQIPKNTIHGVIWNLEVKEAQHVFKPARGMYLHTKYRDTTEAVEPKSVYPAKEKTQESAFYEPFADWLINELEECTKAIPVGGNVFKDKWGTPDVIGIREPRKSDIIKFPTEIVTAEIKLDSTNLITAFGQACAYRLFSHKSYIVVPSSSLEDDIARLDTLSRIFGIGLILFDSSNPKDPQFTIRVRATKHDPDMFYVNRCMKIIEDDLFS
jgi:hypothetical protein